jgi:hypothetical protein
MIVHTLLRSKLTMIQTSKPHMSLTYVLNFLDLDKRVRLEQARAEDVFGSLVNGQSQQTNLPDDFDPNQPRIIFPSEKKTIFISQVACQFVLNFPPSEFSWKEKMEISKKNINLFVDKAFEFKSNYHAQTLSLEFRYPSSNSSVELASYIYDRFLKIDPAGDIAASVLQIGFSFEGLYLNLNVNPYESRKMPEPSSTTTFIRAETLPIVESGIQIRIEANNLPDLQAGLTKDGTAERLMAAVEKFFTERFDIIFALPMS